MKFLFWKKPVVETGKDLTSIYATRDSFIGDMSNWDELIDNTDKILREQNIGLRDLEIGRASCRERV